MRRALYLTIVRSIFENCPYVWKPSSESAINKLESLQKRAIKWINHGENYFTCPSYTAVVLHLAPIPHKNERATQAG